MAFNPSKTFDDSARDAERAARQALTSLKDGLSAWEEWQSQRAGRDDTTIAAAFTALGRATTAAEVAQIDALYAALKVIYDFADNVPGPVQGDRFFALRVFS